MEKFNYLRSFLQGPVLHAITGVMLTAAKYQEVVEMLEKRFGDKQEIIDKHMEVLLSVEAVTFDMSLRALRHLYDTIEAQVRGLKSMSVTCNEYGSLLSSVVLSKIAQQICLIISHEIGDGDWKLDHLMKLLLSELRA